MKRKILACTLVFLMVFSNQVYALDNETDLNDDLSKYTYTVSDDPNFVDGTMSNPDGYEESGVEIKNGNTDIIYQSKARGSGYDLQWRIEDGKKVMYDGYGNRFGYGECKQVIDVSSHNGGVDWNSVKNSGIDGAILRITSFAGGTMHEDDQFAANLAGCRNNGLPFGVYMYSYADNTAEAANEANYVVGLLRKYGVRPSELRYSVYYDLEGNSSTSHLTVDQNAANVETFVSILSANGYPVNVYSYTSYLNNNLNSSRIHKYVSWVAQYGRTLTFKNNYYTGNYGWQYRSNGRVNGVAGDVDVSCFSNFYGYDSENHVNEELGRDPSMSNIEYRAKSNTLGWLPYFVEPNTAGTTGRSFPLYQLQIKLNNALNSAHLSGTVKTSNSILEYANIESNTLIGTDGVAMRQVKFNLENVPGYHLEYRVHSADIGWQDWVLEGNFAGNASKDIQAIDFRLVQDDSVTVKYPQIYYRGHISDLGWLEYVPDTQVAGEPGSGKAMEALNIGFDNPDEDYTLNGSVYVDGLGWQNYESIDSDTVIGTTGQSKAIKAIKLNLKGLSGYSIEYSVYIAGKGWQNWTSSNEIAGDTVNNIEGIKIRLNYDNSKIAKVELDKTNLTMNLDSNETLIARVRPDDTTMDKTLVWQSSDPSIVSVDQNGNLTAHKIGKTTITVTTINGLSANCDVKVIIPITEVKLDKTKITLEKADTTTLTTTILPENTTEDKTITWSSENEAVAKVDKNGKITAVDAGTTNIVATTINGITAKCSVTVTSKITDVSLNKTTLEIEKSESETLVATIDPENTTDDKTLTWTTSNKEVAEVNSNGKVTGKSEGTATITVKTDGEMAGTTDQKKRMEAIKISLSDTSSYSGKVEYRAHVQDIGWQDWVSDGILSGTENQSKQMEAIEIKLTGDIAETYDIYYRVHVQELGWMDWAKNGASAGTAGYSYRIEAIEIRLVEKGKEAPGAADKPFVQHYVKYSTHVQDYGWMNKVYDGSISGTEGESKRLEAITINLDNAPYEGKIKYQVHVQDIGWQSWREDGASAGTTNQKKRLEAIRIKLTEEMEEKYDIYYRVHCQDYGWLGWAKNGESAGSEGESKRLEAIQIVFVEKGGEAPGSTENAFHKK